MVCDFEADIWGCSYCKGSDGYQNWIKSYANYFSDFTCAEAAGNDAGCDIAEIESILYYWYYGCYLHYDEATLQDDPTWVAAEAAAAGTVDDEEEEPWSCPYCNDGSCSSCSGSSTDDNSGSTTTTTNEGTTSTGTESTGTTTTGTESAGTTTTTSSGSVYHGDEGVYYDLPTNYDECVDILGYVDIDYTDAVSCYS